jgi:hypothetical protein
MYYTKTQEVMKMDRKEMVKRLGEFLGIKPKYLGAPTFDYEIGTMEENHKPTSKLLGEDGNIFSILGRVSRTLKEHGKEEQAKEVCERVMASCSYDEALQIIMEYVEVE